MKYYVLNLGCAMNQADSERIQTVLGSLGYEKTEDEDQADLLGIVACSVRQKSIDRVYHKIHNWNIRKDRKNLLTFVSGCILPADEAKFLKKFDLLFRINELYKVPDMIRQYGVVTPWAGDQREIEEQALTGSESIVSAISSEAPILHSLQIKKSPQDPLGDFWNVAPTYTSAYEAHVPIQNGCDKFCTFCAVPYTRGREVSRPSDEILREVEDLVNRGFKSITLLGQNVNSYGLDKQGQEISFAQLLEKIGQMGIGKPPFWVYFTSPHPRDMGVDVLETVAKYPVLAKQIHLPLQSGDEKVLIRMNRNHGMDQYREIVENIRRILPEATLFTDIIVGFTGESEEQFMNSLRAMEEFKYQMAFIASYSPRPGAASSQWKDDIPLDEKKSRLHRLTQVMLDTSYEYNLKQVGKVIPILVERPDKKQGYLSGRTEGRILVRFASERKDLVGQFINLKITSAVPLSLEGVIQES